MTECGVEERIYDELGGWVDSVACSLEKGHPGEHQGTYSWQTEEQLMAVVESNERLRKRHKRDPSQRGEGGG